MKLAAYLTETKETPEQFALKVGVDTSLVSRWKNEKVCPSPQNQRRILQATNGLVTPNDFISLSDAPLAELHQ